MALLYYPIIELDTIDSTNNYAMTLIDANKAQHGLTIMAKNQLAGKGQRGKTWVAGTGECLMMSLIVAPKVAIREQFVFSAAVAGIIAKILKNKSDNYSVQIKWPNDIIVNDKKAGGILIENVLRGSNWTHSIIGLGLNVKQTCFPPELPYATSLKIESGFDFDLRKLCEEIRDSILMQLEIGLQSNGVKEFYNECLYKKGCLQKFSNDTGEWQAEIIKAMSDGTLAVRTESGTTEYYIHGQENWVWG